MSDFFSRIDIVAVTAFTDAAALFEFAFEADEQLVFNEAALEPIEVSFDGINVHGRLESSGPGIVINWTDHKRKRLFVRRTGAAGPAMNIVVMAQSR